MHKIKKAIADFRNYLGRDMVGLQKLSEIETIANSVRKQAASEKERADRAIEQGESSANALSSANDRIRKLEMELEREHRVRSQRERDAEKWKHEANELQKQLDVLLGPNEPSPSKTGSANLFDIPSLRSNVRQLRRRFRFCPKPTRVITTKDSAIDPWGRYSVYDLNGIVKNLSVSELTVLGRFVAVLAVVGVPCVIVESSKKFSGRGSEEKIAEEARDKVLDHFIPWFQLNLDLVPAASVGGYRVSVGEDKPPPGMRMPWHGGMDHSARSESGKVPSRDG